MMTSSEKKGQVREKSVSLDCFFKNLLANNSSEPRIGSSRSNVKESLSFRNCLGLIVWEDTDSIERKLRENQEIGNVMCISNPREVRDLADIIYSLLGDRREYGSHECVGMNKLLRMKVTSLFKTYLSECGGTQVICQDLVNFLIFIARDIIVDFFEFARNRIVESGKYFFVIFYYRNDEFRMLFGHSKGGKGLAIEENTLAIVRNFLDSGSYLRVVEFRGYKEGKFYFRFREKNYSKSFMEYLGVRDTQFDVGTIRLRVELDRDVFLDVNVAFEAFERLINGSIRGIKILRRGYRDHIEILGREFTVREILLRNRKIRRIDDLELIYYRLKYDFERHIDLYHKIVRKVDEGIVLSAKEKMDEIEIIYANQLIELMRKPELIVDGNRVYTIYFYERGSRGVYLSEDYIKMILSDILSDRKIQIFHPAYPISKRPIKLVERNPEVLLYNDLRLYEANLKEFKFIDTEINRLIDDIDSRRLRNLLIFVKLDLLYKFLPKEIGILFKLVSDLFFSFVSLDGRLSVEESKFVEYKRIDFIADLHDPEAIADSIFEKCLLGKDQDKIFVCVIGYDEAEKTFRGMAISSDDISKVENYLVMKARNMNFSQLSLYAIPDKEHKQVLILVCVRQYDESRLLSLVGSLTS